MARHEHARILFTADTHFGHKGIGAMTRRPWGTVEEADEALITAWNAVVGPRDTVWHLGDFTMHATPERCAEIFARLRGRKCLIRGNHDGKRVLDLGWEAVEDLKIVRVPCADGFQDGRLQQIVLTHYALRSWPAVHHGAISLFGHTHASMEGTCRSCDVGVDAWADEGYGPVTMEQIVSRLRATQAEPEEWAIKRRQEAERAAVEAE